MTRIEEGIAVAEQSTFGRDGAMFEGLLGFVAQLSVALWSLVILTAVIRFVGMRIYRHAAARKALAETEAARRAAVPAPVAVSARVPLDAPRTRRAEPLPAARTPAARTRAAHSAHAPALTADSVEA
ncbi:hypothetical protein [Cryobacterium sp. N22]|uniref:hypothetical protein n=1 Tax=Cryobacterium sp. N22 TaxID=2048290 RepID=UPI000CE4EF4C|nr:hypothetical protein [Cryobacterium sp. N22]